MALLGLLHAYAFGFLIEECLRGRNAPFSHGARLMHVAADCRDIIGMTGEFPGGLAEVIIQCLEVTNAALQTTAAAGG